MMILKSKVASGAVIERHAKSPLASTNAGAANCMAFCKTGELETCLPGKSYLSAN